MLPSAIVYTSRTGFTKQYAQMLSKKIKLPAYSLDEGAYGLPQGCGVIYFGWIFASHVKGFSKARKHFSICGVCGVGLCDNGAMTQQVRSTTGIPVDIPLFTLQGGFDRSQLKGLNKLLIDLLVKGLTSQQQRSEQDERMLELLQRDANYVREENLTGVLEWFQTL